MGINTAEPVLTKLEQVAAILDPEAWADAIEARKGHRNPQHGNRVQASLRKARLIDMIYQRKG